jgi:hypothetical protein
MTGATLERAPVGSSVGRWIAGGLAIAFGLVTLVEGGHVLFGGPAARAAAGNVVPFVLTFNFTAGFVYVLAGVAALLRRRAAVWVARGLALSTLLVFALFGVHVLAGGAYELRTVIAMSLRSGFWVAQALLLPRALAGDRHA